MKIPTRVRTPRTDVDMVPMINFAFLLLIFFLLIGRFGPLDAFAVLSPRADAPAVAGEATPDQLLVGKDGRLALGQQRLEAAELGPRAAAWQAAHPAEPLYLKADAEFDAAQLVVLLETLREAGVSEVRLLTRRDAGR